MTPAQCQWLANNPNYSTLAVAPNGYAYANLITLNIDGSTNPGMTALGVTPSGPLTGDEIRSVLCGVLTKIGP